MGVTTEGAYNWGLIMIGVTTEGAYITDGSYN